MFTRLIAIRIQTHSTRGFMCNIFETQPNLTHFCYPPKRSSENHANQNVLIFFLQELDHRGFVSVECCRSDR